MILINVKGDAMKNRIGRTAVLGAVVLLGALAAPVRPSAETSVWGGQTTSMPGTFRTLTGESRTVQEADRFLIELMKSSSVSALSVAVVQDGRVAFERVLGLVDPKTGRRAGPDTVFRAASLSKPVFSYLVMKLVDEGLLALDQSLEHYIDPPLTSYPEYASLAGDPRVAALTPAILLSHASGFPNWRRQRWTGPLTFLFDPGREFSYSGEGYHLLQFLIEKRTGRDLAALAKEKVFDPLVMGRTSFLWEDRFDTDFAVDLDAGLGPLIRRSKIHAVSAGSLLTNASDYAKFVLAALDGRGLKPETAAAWRTPRLRVGGKALHDRARPDTTLNEDIQLSWTPGWGWFRCPAGVALFHVGAEEGCENYVVIFPEKKMGIVVFSVSRVPAHVTPPIVEKLLGDIYSPFAWMRY
jgi:CubicO group peptidase (beta-lactamase class C family)